MANLVNPPTRRKMAVRFRNLALSPLWRPRHHTPDCARNFVNFHAMATSPLFLLELCRQSFDAPVVTCAIEAHRRQA